LANGRIVFDIVVTCHKILHIAGKRGFENAIVIRIPTHRERAGDWYKDCADCDELTICHDIWFGKSVLPFDTRSEQYIAHFSQ
jgi:hypothetical protein